MRLRVAERAGEGVARRSCALVEGTVVWSLVDGTACKSKVSLSGGRGERIMMGEAERVVLVEGVVDQ